ncbi:unnamed protein product [Symbiodinium natans]|uniref:Uncharacterized protein n=1 Tax=Symbiodinium natans TaxID=878477 RepID=A0A812KC79_9DINO|nr:unnamed protein product [Symbiodinium natans]
MASVESLCGKRRSVAGEGMVVEGNCCRTAAGSEVRFYADSRVRQRWRRARRRDCATRHGTSKPSAQHPCVQWGHGRLCKGRRHGLSAEVVQEDAGRRRHARRGIFQDRHISMCSSWQPCCGGRVALHDERIFPPHGQDILQLHYWGLCLKGPGIKGRGVALSNDHLRDSAWRSRLQSRGVRVGWSWFSQAGRSLDLESHGVT